MKKNINLKENRSMKSIFIFTAFILPVLLILSIAGCKYDVSQPQWDTPYTFGPAPTISQVEPAEAVAGVNTITIHGQNFDNVLPGGVYFNITPAEIISKNSTTIVLRRPNMATDSATIKIVAQDANKEPKYHPYKITGVIDQYGSFLENTPLGGIGVDANENMYVVTGDTTRTVYMVTPQGVKTILGRAARGATGSAMGPRGFYMFGAHREIERYDPSTGTIAVAHRLKTNRQIRLGAFDQNGYLYVSGNRTGIWVIAPDSSSTDMTTLYPTTSGDSVYAMKVFDNYLYVSLGTANGRGIYRQAIGAAGVLGPQELVTNLAQFSGRAVTSINFSANGLMFLGTDSPDPLLVFNPADGSIDTFYKNIILPYMKQTVWGTGNFIYMISGNTTPAQPWTIYRVNLGSVKAP